MCGIAGFVNLGSHRVDLTETVVRMTNRLAHRGPDSSDIWVDKEHGIALGHRRLAVIDLSPAGNQPMASECGRYILVFNGEIFNHLELRRRLEAEGSAPNWRGYSDTETFLAAINAWGLKRTVDRSVGQFAFGLWDRRECILSLVRDRLGEKPLYYGWTAGNFVFASELKALRSAVDFQNSIDRNVLGLYVQFCHVPAPYSIYSEIFKLEPGCLLTARVSDLNAAPSETPFAPYSRAGLTIERYWSLEAAVIRGQSSLIQHEHEAVEALDSVLKEAIRLQLVADVPLGVFLSGGVDSSTVAALMQAQAPDRVKTFTIGFADQSYDESKTARRIANHLGTNHTEVILTEDDARSVIPDMARVYCEPFADSSQVPTTLVARTAAQSVTVALSGDAGDELFGGYNRYVWAPILMRRLAMVPPFLRRFAGSAARLVPGRAYGALGSLIGVNRLQEKAEKLWERVGATEMPEELYASLVREWPKSSNVVRGAGELPTVLDRAEWPNGIARFENRMMALDALTYLPDDILHKVDRAAMAHGLETRAPFLDHRVVEFAWRLPLSMKIRDGQGKWALRQVLSKYVPPGLTDRPKSGFALPIGQWLRQPLRAWADALLDPAKLSRDGYLDGTVIRAKWREHLTGSRDWTASIWSVLMFQAWLDEIRSS